MLGPHEHTQKSIPQLAYPQSLGVEQSCCKHQIPPAHTKRLQQLCTATLRVKCKLEIGCPSRGHKGSTLIDKSQQQARMCSCYAPIQKTHWLNIKEVAGLSFRVVFFTPTLTIPKPYENLINPTGLSFRVFFPLPKLSQNPNKPS